MTHVAAAPADPVELCSRSTSSGAEAEEDGGAAGIISKRRPKLSPAAAAVLAGGSRTTVVVAETPMDVRDISAAAAAAEAAGAGRNLGQQQYNTDTAGQHMVLVSPCACACRMVVGRPSVPGAAVNLMFTPSSNSRRVMGCALWEIGCSGSGVLGCVRQDRQVLRYGHRAAAGLTSS